MNNIIMIAKDKQSYLPIATPANPSKVEKTAAEELCTYLKKATGATFTIVTENCALEKAIYVGHTEYAASCAPVCTGEEQWYIKAHNGNLVISGGRNPRERGLIYGAFHFLEDVLGIRWWNEWEEYVPSVNEFFVADDLAFSGEPKFAMRQISTRHCKRDLRFVARTRQSGNPNKEIVTGWALDTAQKYGGFFYGGGPHHVHTLPLYINPETYFDAHPDWFAWDDMFKEHNPEGQLCFCNDEMIAELTRLVLAAIEEDNKMAARLEINKPTFYSLSLADGGGHCQCEKCKKSVAESGMLGHILKMVNKVAREVAKVYPETMLETLAYSRYRDKPKDGTTPEKNVLIRLADVYTDILHNLNHRHNKEQKKNVVEWGELSRKNDASLLVWDYYMYQYPYYPLPMLFNLEENFKVYAENGVKGVYIETHEDVENGMWTMQNWLMSKMMENPDVCFADLLDDFLFKYYGAAGEYIKQYLYLLRDAAYKYETRVVLHFPTSQNNFIDLDTVLRGNEYLEKALDAVKDSNELSNRVKILRADLDKTIAIRHDDFIRLAKAEGKTFDLSRAEAADRALEAYDILEKLVVYGEECEPARQILNYGRKTMRLNREAPERLPLPGELSYLNPDDVYEFIVPLMHCMDEKDGVSSQVGQGAIVVDDADAIGGKALMIEYEQIINKLKRQYEFSKKDGDPQIPLLLDVKRTTCWRDPDPFYRNMYYLEDIKANEYALYSLCGIKGTSSDSDYTFNLFGPHEITFDLSALSIVFPADEYDIHARIKFTGEMYGGNKDDKNAIYLDRIYVVRKNK